MEISWLNKNKDSASTGKVGGYIYRIFTHQYNTTDYKTKRQITKTDISIERYTILAIEEDIVTISEMGNKSDGTYGYRKYNKRTGFCLDDKVPPSNKSRRSIIQF